MSVGWNLHSTSSGRLRAACLCAELHDWQALTAPDTLAKVGAQTVRSHQGSSGLAKRVWKNVPQHLNQPQTLPAGRHVLGHSHTSVDFKRQPAQKDVETFGRSTDYSAYA